MKTQQKGGGTVAMEPPQHTHPGDALPSSGPDSTSRKLAYGWVIVGLLWVVACLNYLDRMMLVSMRESVKANIQMSEAQFGLLTSVFLWVYGALSPLGGFVADRFSRKWVIVGSLGMWSLMTWLTGQVHNFAGLLVARALMGVSEACYIPAGLALIAQWHRGSTRSLATGIHMSGLYAGLALGGLGGYIAQRYDWRQGFSWFGLFGIAYAFVLVCCLREGGPEGAAAAKHQSTESDQSRRAERSAQLRCASSLPPTGTDSHNGVVRSAPPAVIDRAPLRALFGQRSFWALVAYFSLAAVASWGINGWLPTFLGEQFSLGQGQAGLSATGYIQIGSYAGVLLGGAWSDRWVQRTPRGRLYVVLIGFCVGGPSLCVMASTHLFAVAIAGMIFYGLARGFSDANTMPILCQIVGDKYRATGYGFLNLFSTFAGGLMIYLGGALRDANVNLRMVFQASAIGLVLAGLVLLAVRPNPKQEES